MTVKRWSLFVLLITPLIASAGTASLAVGDTIIQFPVALGYLPLSSGFPKAFAYSAAALPSSNELLEAFVTPSDMQRMREGVVTTDPYFQVQALRKLESRKIAIGDWNAQESSLSAGMARLDLNSAISSSATEAGAKLSKLARKDVDVAFGKIGTPTVYRETPTSVRFDLRVPISLRVNGIGIGSMMLTAGAITLVRNKVVLVYLYQSEDAGAQFALLNEQLDATVDKMVELNPNDPTITPAKDFDWSQFVRYALIGALAGAVGWWFRKKSKPPKAA